MEDKTQTQIETTQTDDETKTPEPSARDRILAYCKGIPSRPPHPMADLIARAVSLPRDYNPYHRPVSVERMVRNRCYSAVAAALRDDPQADYMVPAPSRAEINEIRSSMKPQVPPITGLEYLRLCRWHRECSIEAATAYVARQVDKGLRALRLRREQRERYAAAYAQKPIPTQLAFATRAIFSTDKVRKAPLANQDAVVNVLREMEGMPKLQPRRPAEPRYGRSVVEAVNDGSLQYGYRWFVVTWLRKDWAARLANPGRILGGGAKVNEHGITLIPVKGTGSAYIRIPVLEGHDNDLVDLGTAMTDHQGLPYTLDPAILSALPIIVGRTAVGPGEDIPYTQVRRKLAALGQRIAAEEQAEKDAANNAMAKLLARRMLAQKTTFTSFAELADTMAARGVEAE